jgi:quercetin dioxygenase-like cupin family protein
MSTPEPPEAMSLSIAAFIERAASLLHGTGGLKEIAGEVGYSRDCVTSKIIYKGPNVILTLFALAKDQSIAEHTTPFDALVQVLEGKVRITIGGKKKVLKRTF